MNIIIQKLETLNNKPFIEIWFEDKQVVLKEDEFENLKDHIELFEKNTKDTAFEAPVQEQYTIKVSFEQRNIKYKA